MPEITGSLFEAQLRQHDSRAWDSQLGQLLPSIHEVDREATRIWFAFFPLALAQALERADDPEQLAARLLLRGRYRLADQIDSSHRFLYGHRYWPGVKQAIADRARAAVAPADLGLAAQIETLAADVAGRLGVAPALLVGITAVAFMTLRQVGLESFEAAPGAVASPATALRRSATATVTARRRRLKTGFWNLIKGYRQDYLVTFDEHDAQSTFRLINNQELATAAASDKRDYRSADSRCTDGEGPIPVQCRAASCGTCWVGVLSGAENLASVVERDEGRRTREFGYIDTDEPKPLIRLACQAQGFGPVTIVIPPWNGVFGRFLRSQE